MPRRTRNYAEEEARRNQLAQALGWSSRAQKRRAEEKFKISSVDVQGKFNLQALRKGWTKQERDKAFRAYWKGLVDPKTRSQKGRNSAKAEWFIDYVGIDMDYDQWEERYGK